jgi:smad nuclear-interacting protein 1
VSVINLYHCSSTQPENREGEDKKKKVPKEKPNFSLSGKLSEEQRTTANGAILKFVEPPDAKKPLPGWRLYPFKNDAPLGTLISSSMLQTETSNTEPIHLHKQSAYLFGRDRGVCDVPLDHTSISKQHAVIQFRAVDVPTADGLSTKKVVR